MCRQEEELTYRAIFQDVRQAVDWVHLKGTLKQVTCARLDLYVQRSEQLGEMLSQMGVSAKLFLLTNSDWDYSNVGLPPVSLRCRRS